jgi:hypothetical protein
MASGEGTLMVRSVPAVMLAVSVFAACGCMPKVQYKNPDGPYAGPLLPAGVCNIMPPGWKAPAGTRCRLYVSPKHLTVYIAATDDDLGAYWNCNLKGDREGIASLIQHRRLFPVDSDTPVEVLDSHRSGARVRVLDGPEDGRVGYVLPRCLR